MRLYSVLRTYVVTATLVLGTVAQARSEEIVIGGTGALFGTLTMLVDAYETRVPAAAIEVLPTPRCVGGAPELTDAAENMAAAARTLTDATPTQVIAESAGADPISISKAAPVASAVEDGSYTIEETCSRAVADPIDEVVERFPASVASPRGVGTLGKADALSVPDDD